MDESDLDEVVKHALQHNAMSRWQLIPYWLRKIRRRFLNTKRIWFAAFRSFLGHIQCQSAKSTLHLQLPLAMEESPTGWQLEEPRRTLLIGSIEKLSASRPWLDIVDLGVFLEGFQAGEDAAAYIRDSQSNTQAH
jgi:hypothetical protein